MEEERVVEKDDENGGINQEMKSRSCLLLLIHTDSWVTL